MSVSVLAMDFSRLIIKQKKKLQLKEKEMWSLNVTKQNRNI